MPQTTTRARDGHDVTGCEPDGMGGGLGAAALFERVDD